MHRAMPIGSAAGAARRRWPISLALLAALGALGAAALEQPSHAVGAAGVKTYVRTYTGTDFHTFDQRLLPQGIANSGGAVYPFAPGAAPQRRFLELGLDLPDGAQITEVTFHYVNCASPSALTVYAGAYAPGAGSFSPVVGPFNPTATGACTLQSSTSRGAPIATVHSDSQRYVLGARFDTWETSADAPLARVRLVGARVTYTCTNACR